MKKQCGFLFIIFFMIFTQQLNSQSNTSSQAEQEKLAQAAANPIANMISVPLQLNLNFGMGEYNRPGQVLNIMPVLPFKFFNWNVINRFILPIMNVPDTTETGNLSGIANTNYSMFFVPPPPGKGIFMYGFGPAFNIPSGQEF